MILHGAKWNSTAGNGGTPSLPPQPWRPSIRVSTKGGGLWPKGASLMDVCRGWVGKEDPSPLWNFISHREISFPTVAFWIWLWNIILHHSMITCRWPHGNTPNFPHVRHVLHVTHVLRLLRVLLVHDLPGRRPAGRPGYINIVFSSRKISAICGYSLLIVSVSCGHQHVVISWWNMISHGGIWNFTVRKEIPQWEMKFHGGKW